MTLVLMMSSGRWARADDIAVLARTLRVAPQEKARIAAAVALGRLRDPRGVEPLAAALADASPLVRAVAAAALGQLGDPSALPHLRKAQADPDSSVRKRAGEAIWMISRRPNPAGASDDKAPLPGRFRFAAKEQPRLTKVPRMVVAIKSVSDDSQPPGQSGPRKVRVDAMRAALVAELEANPDVTLDEETAGVELERFAIDATITKFQRRVRGTYVEVLCEIRLSVYDGSGKMLSLVSGGAFVQVAAQTFKATDEPAMRLEALAGAVRGVQPKLVAYLNREAAP